MSETTVARRAFETSSSNAPPCQRRGFPLGSMVDAAEFALAHDGAFGGVASEGRGVPGASRHDRRVLVLEGEHDGQGNPAVSVTLLGLRDVDLFRRVAATLSESDRLPEEERLALEAYGARLRAEGKLEM